MCVEDACGCEAAMRDAYLMMTASVHSDREATLAALAVYREHHPESTAYEALVELARVLSQVTVAERCGATGPNRRLNPKRQAEDTSHMMALFEVIAFGPGDMRRTWLVVPLDGENARRQVPEPFSPVSTTVRAARAKGPCRIIGWMGEPMATR